MLEESTQESFIPHGHRGKLVFSCVQCKDRGAVIATPRGSQEIYAFTCACAAGARRARAYPIFPGEAAGWDVAA